MKTKILLSLLSLISCSNAISGGTLVDSNNELSNYTVRVLSKFEDGTSSKCTGVVLSNNKIVTASHCVLKKHKEKALEVYVYFDNAKMIYQADKVKIPKQRWQSLTNLVKGDTSDITIADLAVIRFKDQIPEPYKPANISNEILDNEPVLSLGYGGTYGRENQTKLNIAQTNILNQYEYDIINIRSTNKVSVKTSVGDKMVYSHICAEDSGGPDFQKINGEYKLISIHYGYVSTSRSPTCDQGENSYINDIKFLSTNITYYKNYNWLIYEAQNSI